MNRTRDEQICQSQAAVGSEAEQLQLANWFPGVWLAADQPFLRAIGEPGQRIAGITGLENLYLLDETSGQVHLGCDQDWYLDSWQRRAGCGPSTAANLLYWGRRVHPGFGALPLPPAADRSHFLPLMNAVWEYITPTMRGTHKISIMRQGLINYAAQYGLRLATRQFRIPSIKYRRRKWFDAEWFLRQALDQNYPVAFLNYSNGNIPGIDSWHWNTLLALWRGKENETIATIADSGQVKQVSISDWYRETRLGGWFMSYGLG